MAEDQLNQSLKNKIEDQNNSRMSVDSISQINNINAGGIVQRESFIKKKFQKQLYIISIVFSLILLGAFLGVFIYYLKNYLLGDKEVLIPNHYLIQSINLQKQSVQLQAQYQGEQDEQFPNIYSNILVTISLQNITTTEAATQDNNTYLTIDIREDKLSNPSAADEEEDGQINENQLSLSDVDLGPFDLEYSDPGSKLGFIVSRSSTGEKIFDTLDFDILVSQYYSTVGTTLPRGQFYGLGERRTSFFSYEGTYKGLSKNCTYGYCNRYRFWNRNPIVDQIPFDTGLGAGQLSGYQPTYLMQEESENYSLIFIDNAFSGLEIDYYQTTASTSYIESLVFQNYNSAITFRIFLGDTYPDTVIKQYHSYIGKFSLIPFWAMGYHHSKTFLYPFAQNLKSYLESLDALNIPIDSLWTNVEFNYDGNYFKILSDELITGLTSLKNDYQLKWIPLIPSEISDSVGCRKYVLDGQELEVFIRSNKTNTFYIGSGLFGKSFFIDYNHVNASQLLAEALQDLYKQVQFDGLWLNKNEPSTLLTGEYITNDQLDKSNGQFDTIYNFTDFKFNQDLINIDALHYNQPDAVYYYNQNQGTYLYEKDLHSSNGYMQSATTYKIMQQQFGQQQPFIISSSSRPGSGQFIAHSTGAAVSTWSLLQASFTEIFNFQLFGIPFTGSNVCPLKVLSESDTKPMSELCTRWYQAASVYPFIHSTQFLTESDPFQFKDYSYVLNSVKESLQLRYSLLKHYYSLYVLSRGIGMVFKPVSFVFPKESYQDYFISNTNNTAMIGDSLYVYTVMTPGDTTTNSTQVLLGVPPNLWVNLQNTHIQYKGPYATKYNFPFTGSPLIFLREGHLILWQKINEQKRIRASLLDSSFVIKAVLNITSQNNLSIQYSASGKTLGVLDYGNSEALNKCGIQGCELNISLNVTSTNNNQLDIEVTFLANDDQYFEQGIIIKEVQVSGVIKYNEMLLEYCNTGDISSQPFDYITVKDSLSPANYFIVTKRSMKFNLSISF